MENVERTREPFQARVVMSGRDTYKAKYKKGQKVCLPYFETDGKTGEPLLYFYQGLVMRAQKNNDTVDTPNGPAAVSTYTYEVTWTDSDGKEHGAVMDESELYKYSRDLMDAADTLEVEKLRNHAWQARDYKALQEKLEKVPERLRLRIPVNLKKCLLEDYERACVKWDVEAVRPRKRQGAVEKVGRVEKVENEKIEENEAEEEEAAAAEEEEEEEDMDVDRDDEDYKATDDDDDHDHDEDWAPTTSARARATRGSREQTQEQAKILDKSTYSVADIVEMWRKQALNEDDVIQDDALADAVNIIAESLKTYFNESLYQFLLYPAELAAYNEVVGGKRETKPADVYGVEHLVRLLVKLPELVCVQMMVLPMEPARNIVAVEDRLNDLMRQLEAWFFPATGEREGVAEGEVPETEDETA